MCSGGLFRSPEQAQHAAHMDHTYWCRIQGQLGVDRGLGRLQDKEQGSVRSSHPQTIVYTPLPSSFKHIVVAKGL